jgi:YesN/AraC family two-component response regulator
MPSLPQLLRVLIVDDEQVVADSLALICVGKGHAVRAAYSAEEAIEPCRWFHPHAVVSDVRMPGMSGVDLAIHLNQAEPECRVLLVSGYETSFAIAEGSIQRGCFHAILPKPIRPSEVLEFHQACADAIENAA